MNCINTGCMIFNGCKIKEVAHHCIIHKKMVFTYGDTVEKDAELSVNSNCNDYKANKIIGNGSKESEQFNG